MTTTPVEIPVNPRCLPRELLASAIFLLGRVGFAVKMRAMEEFESEGFSPYHYGVLALLEESPRETQAAIADTLKVDRSQLVGLLDALEERNLIERQRDPMDRRRHVVKLTAEGRRQLDSLRAITARIEEEFLAPLDADDRNTLRDLLLRIGRHRDSRFSPDAA
jgi:DNA-binding MarR family transcriptional regulator